jgi:hypothetical protein
VVLVAGDNLVVDDRGFVGRACAGWRAQYQHTLATNFWKIEVVEGDIEVA